MLNKTTVPFEQTTVEGGNQTEAQQQGQSGQQQGQGNQTGTQQGQSGQQQGNQSSGPLEQLGEAITAPFQ